VGPLLTSGAISNVVLWEKFIASGLVVIDNLEETIQRKILKLEEN